MMKVYDEFLPTCVCPICLLLEAGSGNNTPPIETVVTQLYPAPPDILMLRGGKDEYTQEFLEKEDYINLGNGEYVYIPPNPRGDPLVIDMLPPE